MQRNIYDSSKLINHANLIFHEVVLITFLFEYAAIMNSEFSVCKSTNQKILINQ